uniref:OSJNBa0091D06.2 protein n=1 Tax=Oryza sativa subsp. japonica TaxID=39947 RepID=Q7XQR2_ORYSJ|nr:OSJNBa0091D06.2 [Oryza sativa Japonica Group]
MDLEAKFDLLLKTISDNEKKRVEGEERTRAEYLELRKTVESRIPAVEKKAETLGESVQSLNAKVDHLEGNLLRQVKSEAFGSTAAGGAPGNSKQDQAADKSGATATPMFGMKDNFSIPHINFGSEPETPSPGSGSASFNLSNSIPPMICPHLVSVYWVKIATLNFCGNAAFWLPSVRNQICGISWTGLCELVCTRFSKDRQQALIRQWIHIRQEGFVSEYVEKFDSLMHQLLAYDNSLLPVYFVTKFVEGLRSDIRVVVLVQRPQDLDSTCAITLLQEEALEGIKFNQYRKPDSSIPVRSFQKTPALAHTATPQKQFTPQHTEDKRGTESARAREEKLAALKSYRRSKGLCFTCGERWSRDHKCGSAVQLHVVQELLDALQDETPDGDPETPSDSNSDLMAISQQALWGTESSKSIRLRGLVQGSELLMLLLAVDGGCKDLISSVISDCSIWEAMILSLGIVPQTTHCSVISTEQYLGMVKQGSIMHIVQLSASDPVTKEPLPSDVQELINSFQDVFSEPTGLPPKRYCDHSIPLILGAAPVSQRPYRFNPALKNEIEKQVAEMLQSGVIQPSSSPFSSPALLVKKKDGTWRLVIDYRKLNTITVKGTYPMPVIDELLDELSHAKWFTKLDLRAGYHQIRMAPGEEYKTAFQTHTGHYEYTVMSFGLTEAPATFQRAMNDTLKTVLRKFVLVFFDDILIYSPDWSSHLDHIAQVLSLLNKHHWKVKLSKCSFAQRQLTYLGHTISAAGVHTDKNKIQEVVDWKVPISVKKLRGFLGLAGYYRKFVKGFGVISKPLTNLLRKGVPFHWNSETESAFQHLKQALVSAPVLALPDFQKVFTVETDASETGIGAVLSQDGHPIAFISKALGVTPRTSPDRD